MTAPKPVFFMSSVEATKQGREWVMALTEHAWENDLDWLPEEFRCGCDPCLERREVLLIELTRSYVAGYYAGREENPAMRLDSKEEEHGKHPSQRL